MIECKNEHMMRPAKNNCRHCTASLVTLLACVALPALARTDDCAFGSGLDNLSPATAFGEGVLSTEDYECQQCSVADCVTLESQLVFHRVTADVDFGYKGLELAVAFDHDLPDWFTSWATYVRMLRVEDGENAGIYQSYGVSMQAVMFDEDAFGPGRHRMRLLLGTPLLMPAGDYVVTVMTQNMVCPGDPSWLDTRTFSILSAEIEGQQPTGFVFPLPADLVGPGAFYEQLEIGDFFDNEPFNPAIRVLYEPVPLPVQDWTCTPGCPGDGDGDGQVTLRDINLVLANFGKEDGGHCQNGDVNGDCRVNIFDVQTVVQHYGNRCG